MWDLSGTEAQFLYGVAFFICVIAAVMTVRSEGWRKAIVGWPLWIIAAIAVDQYVWWRL